MDARFDELTGVEEKKHRAGFGAWAVLFLSVFLGVCCCVMAVAAVGFSGWFPKIIKLFLLAFLSLGMSPMGWPAIIHYRIRALRPIRYVTFLASAAAVLVIGVSVHGDFLQLYGGKDSAFIDFIIAGMLGSVALAGGAARRAKYAYSEKTGNWLNGYISKKRLLVDPEDSNPKTIEEILTLDAVKRPWRDWQIGVPALALFLDSEPNGEHYLWCAFREKYQSSFSLTLEYTSVIIPIDWKQAELLRDRVGDFEKPVFIPGLSVKVGDWIRERAQQGDRKPLFY